MRDAYGGIVNISMIVIFLVVVMGYLAFSVTYTKAFRMKNKVITIIEQNEGCSRNRQDCEKEIGIYSDAIGYNPPQQTDCDSSYEQYGHGVCVRERPVGDSDNPKAYYDVEVNITIEIPVIKNIIEKADFSLSGSTKLITLR